MSGTSLPPTMPSPIFCDSSNDSNVDTHKYIAIPSKFPSFDLDEEKGFWGEDISEEEDSCQCSDDVWPACGVLIYSILGVIAVLMVMRGFGKYLLGHETPTMPAYSGVEMRFCLQPQPTSSVGPRIWEYISSSRADTCEKGILTMFTTSEEALKIHHGDRIMNVRDEGRQKSLNGHRGNHEDVKFLDGGIVDEANDEELGDDLAEEGKLRMPPPDSMRAGFGGPWRRRDSFY